MPPLTPPILDTIVAGVRATLPDLRMRAPELERLAREASVVPSFRSALSAGGSVALIAEVKRRSPSAGAISADLDPARHAAKYAASGAAAISVLTEKAHFGGAIDDLVAVRAEVQVPLLRKDFIVDELQLLEARAAGASAALLIVRILPPKRLEELLTFGRGAGLDLLVETHTRAEIDVALTAGADIIGVNCRDLDTFQLDPDRAWELLTAIPPDRLTVAESAMHTRADVEQAARAGADAVLVGTALSSAADPSALTRDLASVPRVAR
ncbi:MAG TPA: indole-3-glycerol phosphate synthase TrpC [Gemmatimonadales bacterium]|nr:indole-3-glycerol phosphate synthase TrpC [Gemmatimonadales bacterium]